MAAGLDFGVLGPLTVRRGDEEIVIPRRRQRLLLVRLVVDVGKVVASERLLEELWPAATGSDRTGPVRHAVWELRRLLDVGDRRHGDVRGRAVVASDGSGYRLAVDGSQVDSVRFEARLDEARAMAAGGSRRPALASVDEALSLGRGPALGDLADEPALQVEARRLDQLVLDAHELRAELLLAMGRHAEAASHLERLAGANPERERLWALLMTALHRAGRRRDALRRYEEVRAALVDTVGVEPGPELRLLEHAIRHGDPPPHDLLPPDVDRSSPAPAGEVVSSGQAVAAGEPVAVVAHDPAGGHNLPRPPTSLVGRTTESREVARLLDSSRLVSLVGPGGCGKTRLAIAVVEDLLARFPGGVDFVDLSTTTQADQVAATVSAAVDRRTGSPARAHAQATDDTLLVLDNCEHVLDDAAAWAADELARNPSRRILTTSREELRLAGETVYRIGGLRLPDGPSAAPFLGSEAVELFVTRAAAVLPGFAPTGATLHVVGQMCRRLEGWPLAIELAAALVGSLPVQEIADRLGDRLQLLDGVDRGRALRHQSVQATLDWSFGLLDPESEVLLATLGVFAGTFTLDAAVRVTGEGTGTSPVGRGIDRLVRASMVERLGDRDGVERYHMLETIRQYARDHLERLDRVDDVSQRHARYYCDLAIAGERRLRGASADEWFQDVVAEVPNLRLALQWAMTHDQLETGLRLVGSLRWVLPQVGSPSHVASWLDGALRQREGLAPSLELRLLTAASMVAFQRGDLVRADPLADEAIELARVLDATDQLTVGLLVKGAGAVLAGRLAEAQTILHEAEELCVSVGDRWGMGWTSASWALAAFEAGSLDQGRRRLEQALDIFQRLHDPTSQVPVLTGLAFDALARRQNASARELAREAVDIAESCDCPQVLHLALVVCGGTEQLCGDSARARDHWLRALRDFSDSSNSHAMAGALDGLAWLAMAAGRVPEAVSVLGFSADLRRRNQAGNAPYVEVVDGMLAYARAQLGPDLVQHHLDRGRRLDLDAVCDLADAASTGISPPATA